eukprot:10339880-Lingulodinium_polyedra.AAC.1
MADIPVPEVHFFFAGFECDSVSGYNRGPEGQKTMGDCVFKANCGCNVGVHFRTAFHLQHPGK